MSARHIGSRRGTNRFPARKHRAPKWRTASLAKLLLINSVSGGDYMIWFLLLHHRTAANNMWGRSCVQRTSTAFYMIVIVCSTRASSLPYHEYHMMRSLSVSIHTESWEIEYCRPHNITGFKNWLTHPPKVSSTNKNTHYKEFNKSLTSLKCTLTM